MGRGACVRLGARDVEPDDASAKKGLGEPRCVERVRRGARAQRAQQQPAAYARARRGAFEALGDGGNGLRLAQPLERVQRRAEAYLSPSSHPWHTEGTSEAHWRALEDHAKSNR